jgi:hypothetical protein
MTLNRVAMLGLVLACGACTDTVIENGKIGTTATLYTTADIRIVTERFNPTTGRTVICTEPSPDVAKALSTAAQLSGKGASGPEVAFNFASAEAAAELAGRTTALVGLRDGLFEACEAYANGSIGALAYLLVLNRYGELMTTLFLGQDVQGSAGAAELARIQSPSLTVGGAQAGGSGNKGGTGGGSQQGQQTPSNAAGQTATATAAPDPALEAFGSELVRLASWTPQREQVAAVVSGGTAAAKSKPKVSQSKNTQSSSTQGSGNSPSGGTTVSADLTQMQKNYLSLATTESLAHLMALGCLEEFDLTRGPAVAQGQVQLNRLLEQNCPSFIGGLMQKLSSTLQAK